MTPAIADPTRLLTVEEYVALPDDGPPTELVRGRVVEMTPPTIYHGYVCGNVLGIVRAFVRANKLGRAMSNDTGVITHRDPDTLRGADVMYYSYARLPAGSLANVKYPPIAPDLIFEVVSPSDRWSQVLAKMTEYLTAGVTAVCVVNPRDQTAVVYRDNQNPEPVAADAELTLPDVLPGFRVPLREFFE